MTVVLGRCEAEVLVWGAARRFPLRTERCLYQARHQRPAVDGSPINVCGTHLRKQSVVRWTSRA